MTPPPSGIERIAAERARQLDVEGWTAKHDDAHLDGELAWAAVCYAAPEKVFVHNVYARSSGDAHAFADPWPFDEEWDKRELTPTPEERIRQLEKAGALIAAEIDRLLRAAGGP